MHSTGIVLSRPATPCDIPRSAWTCADERADDQGLRPKRSPDEDERRDDREPRLSVGSRDRLAPLSSLTRRLGGARQFSPPRPGRRAAMRSSSPSAGKRYDGPWTWTAATISPRASAIGRRDGADPSRTRRGPRRGRRGGPREAAQQRGGVGERARRERLQRLREVAGEHRCRQLGEEDLPGRDGVERDPRAGPVADLDRVRVRRLDLVDVLDGPAVADGDARGLAELARPGRRASGGRSRRCPGLAEALGDRQQVRPEPVAALAGDLLDGALGGERGKEARGRRFRDVGTRTATSLTPSGPSASAREHGERARGCSGLPIVGLDMGPSLG